MPVFDFVAPLWRWESNAAWHFVTVPEDISELIAAQTTGPRRGFGSVRVKVTIGASTWSTSVFPDNASQCYVLPVKKAVRVKESLEVDQPAVVLLTLID
jgi:hypothetical protein